MADSKFKDQQIFIDKRSIWIVLFDRLRRYIMLALFFGLFAFLLMQEGPSDLSLEGYKVLCLFVLCVSLWATNLIPLSITSLLAIAAVPLLGVMEASQAYSYFGNKAVFFILGVFILSASMIACGLSTRISIWVMEHWSETPGRLVTSTYCFAGISSCFMSEHAVAVMLFPIIHEIIQSLNLKRDNSVFAKSLYFAMAWGCIIGGAMTVLGGGRVPLGVEMLEKATAGKETLGILQYTQLSFPLVILLFAGGWITLKILFPADIQDIEPARKALRQKAMVMGRLTFQEKGIALIMVGTLFSWFGFGDQLGIANIAIIAIVLLFVLNLITWKMVEAHINWAIVLMYGGAICLGEVMAESGAALWMAEKLFSNLVESGTAFLFVMAILSTLFTTFMSNSAVIAILLPTAISMSPAYGIHPVLATMTVILPSNFAFILPIATPAAALAYSSRFLSLREMVWSGSILSLLGLSCYLLLLLFYWPMLGLR
ncbi:MAG: DASS family sodium-coupled anion symporter [Nitrospinaceae bacterium]|nr:DASS family sodium-coupled anion symporter [Nitrospinaceae bacterium]MBT5867429.1 DASS family sodium-coupled anion symporter [Nitrospinaceae bacterium]MBT6346703.1 DASS family sodium-coupled anion symporter [Nitrospina sp.]